MVSDLFFSPNITNKTISSPVQGVYFEKVFLVL